MARVSMSQVVVLLDVLQRFRQVQQGSLDGRAVTILSSRVHASPEGVRLAATFEVDGARHQVEADHDWRGARDVVRVDGGDVRKGEADLDLDLHAGRVDLEYRLEYEQQGAPHRLLLTARVGL